MAIRRRRRGISFGTIFMLSLSAVTLLLGAIILSDISGNIGTVTIDPKMLTESLTVLARNVTDIGGQDATITSITPSPVTVTAPPAQPTAIATPAPTPPPNRTLTITAAGQVSTGTELRANAAKGGGEYDFYDTVSAVAPMISGSSLSIVTLRTGLSTSTSKFDNYCSPVSLVDGLNAAGFSLFNFATDRVLDHGVGGVAETRMEMETKHAHFSGIYRTQDERSRQAVLGVDGVNVGVLSYTASLSTAGKSAAGAQEATIATRHLDTQAAAAEVTALRAAGAEIVIVLPYWGGRSDSKVSREMQADADALIAAGADIILGTNPTTVLEMERKHVTDTYGEQREVFVAYSLGNFLIDDSRDTANITGVILSLTLDWDAQAHKLRIGDAWYMPTWIMRWRDTAGMNRYRVVPAGTASIPDGMTESIYINMKKAYQNMVNRLGTEAARPREE